MTDHAVIWLEPWCDDCARRDRSDTGRTWCCDPVYDACECGAQPVKYVLAAEIELKDKCIAELYDAIGEHRDEIERLRRELNLLRAVHESAEAEVRQLLDENGSLIAVCREFIDRWPTEEGIDNTIQRARAILLDHDLRSPPKYAVNRALEGK